VALRRSGEDQGATRPVLRANDAMMLTPLRSELVTSLFSSVLGYGQAVYMLLKTICIEADFYAIVLDKPVQYWSSSMSYDPRPLMTFFSNDAPLLRIDVLNPSVVLRTFLWRMIRYIATLRTFFDINVTYTLIIFWM